jgi:hypothetical protein
VSFRILQLAALGAVLLVSQGCYKVRVVAFPPPASPGDIRKDVPPGTFGVPHKVNLYFWGLLQDPPSPVLAENCPTQSMKQVQVTRKGGYIAAAIFTLGIYSAVDISWECAQQPSLQGTPIGGPPPATPTPAPAPPAPKKKKEAPITHADR